MVILNEVTKTKILHECRVTNALWDNWDVGAESPPPQRVRVNFSMLSDKRLFEW